MERKHGLKKCEILRGRNLFKLVSLQGKRLEGKYLRCKFITHEEGDEPLQVAFRVPARNLNAVQRNRMRRLMREAMRTERHVLDDVLFVSSRMCVGMTILYKGEDVNLGRITLLEIRKDLCKFCKTIASML